MVDMAVPVANDVYLARRRYRPCSVRFSMPKLPGGTGIGSAQRPSFFTLALIQLQLVASRLESISDTTSTFPALLALGLDFFLRL